MSSLLTEFADGIATLTINRETVHNALDADTMSQFEAAITRIEEDDSIRTIVLTGAGEKTFCSGGDLKYFAGMTEEKHVLAMSHRMQRILDRIYHGPRVVIGAVNGNSYGGGCEILTACHFRIAVEGAHFSFRQARNGIITGWGGGLRLFRMVGRGRALRLFLTAEDTTAEEALRVGFIDQIVPRENLMDEVLGLARKIHENDPRAVAAFLELSRQLYRDDIDTFRERETALFAECWTEGKFHEVLARYRK
ncbi:MAG: enoyl-CoA hydratase/isomerase family protein [Acidobacteriota bacterium]|nr:enoyl-CoA hydratase/isomerase family protein [Acidobacteriota bacterium]